MKCKIIFAVLLLFVIGISEARKATNKRTKTKATTYSKSHTHSLSSAKMFTRHSMKSHQDMNGPLKAQLILDTGATPKYEKVDIQIYPAKMKIGHSDAVTNADTNTIKANTEDSIGMRFKATGALGSILSQIAYTDSTGATFLPYRLMGNMFNLNGSMRSSCNFMCFSSNQYYTYSINFTISLKEKNMAISILFAEQYISKQNGLQVQKWIDDTSLHAKNRVNSLINVNMGETIVYIDNMAGQDTANGGAAKTNAKVTSVKDSNVQKEKEKETIEAQIKQTEIDIASLQVTMADKTKALSVFRANLVANNSAIDSNKELITNLTKSLTDSKGEAAKFGEAANKAKTSFDQGQVKLTKEAVGETGPANVQAVTKYFVARNLDMVTTNLNLLVAQL
jgi:hypothetical protein